jgi:hypothetical protein
VIDAVDRLPQGGRQFQGQHAAAHAHVTRTWRALHSSIGFTS